MNQSDEPSDKASPLSTSVSSFLLSRKYRSNKEFPRDCQSCSLMDVAVQLAIDSESGHQNVLSSSATSKDASSYFQQLDEQFIALKTFIAGTNHAYKQELLGLKYPIFVNIYLELIDKNQEMKALLFYNQHFADFASEHKEELQHLRGITGPEKLNTSDVAAHFKKSKFVYKLSHKVFKYLVQFLSSENRALLLRFIDKNIHLDVNNTKLSLKQDNPLNMQDSQKRDTILEQLTNYTTCTSSDLMASMKAMREGPPTLPYVMLHKASNCSEGFTTAVVSKDGELLCGGFEDSSVHLWSLTPKKLVVNQENFEELSQVNLGTEVDSEAGFTISAETLTLRGHSGPVYGVCCSQDSSFILSASEDLSVRLWSLKSYTNRVSYIGHNYPVWHVDLSSLDAYFVSTSMDQTARLWNLEYNYPLRIFAGHTASVDTAKFHPNCSYIATASADQTVRLWDVHSGSFVRLFSEQKGSIYALSFTPDGKYLLGAGEDRTIHIWDIASGKHVNQMSGHAHTVYCLATNLCNVLVSGGGDGHIYVWNLDSILKTSETVNQSSSASLKPMHSYSTNCMNILYANFKNDNVLYAVGQ